MNAFLQKPVLRLALAALTALAGAAADPALACTNLIVAPGASTDGSTLCTYSADSYGMYAGLYYYPAARHAKGAMRDVVNWDSNAWQGQIPEPAQTYSVVGNMNEHQLTIAETTYGGRHEMVDTTGLIDYGSLIYIALQRSRTAREAIEVMTSLVNTYGYNSEGETFSICDPSEAWIMEMQGKGPGSKGAVWVAVRIPDNAVCAHANQSRIGRIANLPRENVMASKDVISFARSKGWFKGRDADFSWKEAYAHPDFEGRRFCDARAWSFFRRVADGMDRYLPWALGTDPEAEDMPLYVVPNRKLGVHDLMTCMRDHYEDTPMSLDPNASQNATLAGGLWQMPYRPSPLTFKGTDAQGAEHEYFNERPISTQQTAFTFVAQMRAHLPRHIGGVLWFANDDANMVSYVPVYCSLTRRPLCFNTPGADAVSFSFQSAFWMCNWVSNMVYPRYSALFPDLRQVRDSLDNLCLQRQTDIEAQAAAMKPADAAAFLNDYTIACAARMMDAWMTLAQTLIVKHNDMVVRPQNPDGSFRRSPEGIGAPVVRPGYPAPTRQLLINHNMLPAEP